VVSLRLFAELEVKEIAVTLNKPETAVRMLLHRGIRDLQNRISPTIQEKTQ
jgi:DNA-directed RNA polymerase specialized sigma24 family protein